MSLKLHTSSHHILDANNDPVKLWGVGRAGGPVSTWGVWGGLGDTVYLNAYKWRRYGAQSVADFTTDVDQTLQMLRDVWHCNVIREFMVVDWWWRDNINSGNYLYSPDLVLSNRDYTELIVQRASALGMYVDLCPYSIVCYYEGVDWWGESNAPWGGFPTALRPSGVQAMANIHANLNTAWDMWWTSVYERLGGYDNVIFELWNEPDNPQVKQDHYDYQIRAYDTLRGLGADQLIMMQWRMGLVPNWQEQLTWVPELHNQLTTHLGGAPSNVVYTWHAYKFWFNPNWGTSDAQVLAQLSTSSMVPCTRPPVGTVDVPLVMNEGGPDIYYGAGEMGWYHGLLTACEVLDVGVVAYYYTQPAIGFSPDQAHVSGPWAVGTEGPPLTWAGEYFFEVNPRGGGTPPPPPVPNPTACRAQFMSNMDSD